MRSLIVKLRRYESQYYQSWMWRRWNWTLELFERAYRSQVFTHKCLKHRKYSDYHRLFTTKDERTILKYIMEAGRPFWYWNLMLSKRHTVTLHHVITVCNDMFNHMDGVMRALPMKKTQWKDDLYFTVMVARLKLSKYYVEVTPMMGMLRISALMLDPFWMLEAFTKWDKGMDINSEDTTFYTTKY